MDVSLAEQATGRPCSWVPMTPEIQYVKGEARYIKDQKPGRAGGVCRTPQKMRLIMTSRVTMPPAV